MTRADTRIKRGQRARNKKSFGGNKIIYKREKTPQSRENRETLGAAGRSNGWEKLRWRDRNLEEIYWEGGG